MQGVATLEVTASGSTAYSTGITYSALSQGRSAIIASYTTTAAAWTVTATPGAVVAAGPVEETLTAQNLSDTFGMPIALSVEDGRYAARATSGA